MRPGSAAGPNAPRPIGRADPIKMPPRQSEAGSPTDSASPRHADDPEPTPAHAKDYQPHQPPTTSATPSTRFAQHLESGGSCVASPHFQDPSEPNRPGPPGHAHGVARGDHDTQDGHQTLRPGLDWPDARGTPVGGA